MKPKTKHAVETKHATPQPTAAPMNTTTQQAVEPTPSNAFSAFAKTNPTFQEISAITGSKIFENIKQPDPLTSFRIASKLNAAPKPEPTDDRHFIFERVAPLKEKLKTSDMTKEERDEIQREILELVQAPFKPHRDHQEKIQRLTAAVDAELKAFEAWIKNDPAGIAAQGADAAYNEWQDAETLREQAEKARKDAEAKEAEKQALIEEIRTERKQEAYALGEEIGSALFDTNPDHPDIDGQTMQDFIKWLPENFNRHPRPLNAVLDGLPGVGKSRALAAVAVAKCETAGKSHVEWITGYEFADLVTDLSSSDKKKESSSRLKRLAKCSYLFFDDLGSVNFTPARTARLFSLIDERYRKSRPSFISTNYSTPQLKKVFTATSDSKDEAVRILRRIIGTPSEPLAKFFHFKRQQEIAKAA
jgi:DNA replication protein DnaC